MPKKNVIRRKGAPVAVTFSPTKADSADLERMEMEKDILSQSKGIIEDLKRLEKRVSTLEREVGNSKR